MHFEFCTYIKPLTAHTHTNTHLFEILFSPSLQASNPLESVDNSGGPLGSNLVEVLSSCGPVSIESPVITDKGERRNFTVRLENAGRRTCVRIEWGEGTVTYYGNPTSCR